MQLHDLTKELGTQGDFASQALFKLAQTQTLIQLQFSDVTSAQTAVLERRLRQFDASVTHKGTTVTTLLTYEATKQLSDNWLTWFPGEQEADKQLTNVLASYELGWQANDFQFELREKPMIYAIMNITPDSFYDGGRYTTEEAVSAHIAEMVEAGADLIEVNGQTTRPGYTEVTPEVEIERTIPYIKQIKQLYPDMAVGIDTYKLPVMKAAIDAGVDVINDVNSFTDDPEKLPYLAQQRVGLLTMLNGRGNDFTNLSEEMHTFFEDNIKAITDAGVAFDRIALDQGIGYSKLPDSKQDFVMMRNVDQFNDLNRPMMVAVSRKGFYKQLLGLEKDDRLPMTLITETEMMLKGGRIIRVHDVEETRQMITFLNEIEKGHWLA